MTEILMKQRRRRSKVAIVAVAFLSLGSLTAACSDDDDSAATTSTTEVTTSTTEKATDVCADVDAVQSSVDGLKSIDLVAEGTNSAEAAVDDVKKDLNALADSAGSEFAPQMQSVEDTADAVETSVKKIDADGVAPAVTAVADLVTQTKALLAAVDAKNCTTTTTTS